MCRSADCRERRDRDLFTRPGHARNSLTVSCVYYKIVRLIYDCGYGVRGHLQNKRVTVCYVSGNYSILMIHSARRRLKAARVRKKERGKR